MRDKENPNIEDLVRTFIKLCLKYKIKAMINSRLDLAIKYPFYGVHLNSQQGNLLKKAKGNSLFTLISTHNKKEIKKAKKADALLLSPLFKSPNKGEALGLKKFKRLVKFSKNKKIIALGGIVKKDDIKKVENLKLYGIASIRLFLAKGGH